jgi:hypothetical protein
MAGGITRIALMQKQNQHRIRLFIKGFSEGHDSAPGAGKATVKFFDIVFDGKAAGRAAGIHRAKLPKPRPSDLCGLAAKGSGFCD